MICTVKLVAVNDILEVADILEENRYEVKWFDANTLELDYEKLDEADKQGLINLQILTEETVDECDNAGVQSLFIYQE